MDKCPNLTDASLVNLAGHLTLTNLQITNTKVTNASCVLISQLPHLEEITMDNITAEGLQTLLTCKTLKVVRCYSITVQEKDRLRTLYPAIHFY